MASTSGLSTCTLRALVSTPYVVHHFSTRGRCGKVIHYSSCLRLVKHSFASPRAARPRKRQGRGRGFKSRSVHHSFPRFGGRNGVHIRPLDLHPSGFGLDAVCCSPFFHPRSMGKSVPTASLRLAFTSSLSTSALRALVSTPYVVHHFSTR